MENPSGFGEFFLDGDYVGWDEAVKAYYLNEMSEEEKAERGMQEYFDVLGFSEKFTRDMGPMAPYECPTEFAVKHNRVKSFGSLIKLSDRLLAVDEALRDLIEELEPGVHQFWPIKITLPKGDPYPEQYFGLRIGQFLDSFRPGESDDGAWRERNGWYRVQFPKKQYYAGLALSRQAIAASHLWREKILQRPGIFFSDTLQSEIKKAGLRVPKLSKLKDV